MYLQSEQLPTHGHALFLCIKVLTFPYKLKSLINVAVNYHLFGSRYYLQKKKDPNGLKDAWFSGHGCSDTNI